MLMIHKEEFIVRSYEVDSQGMASAPSICNYLQEVAGNHATELGVAVDHLFKKNMTWVLSRLHVHVSRYPAWRENIKIETWPSGRQGKFATRDFLIYDEKGKILVRATSSWMVIDLKTLRPITMPDFMDDIHLPNRPRAIDDEFPKLPLPTSREGERQFDVRLSDLDINQHVNNVKYIEWALESVPLEMWSKKMMVGLEISFRTETKYGERILIQAEQQDDTYLHRVVAAHDQRDLAVLRTRWKKI
jgi:acyl-ACP thioesterase